MAKNLSIRSVVSKGKNLIGSVARGVGRFVGKVTPTLRRTRHSRKHRRTRKHRRH